MFFVYKSLSLFTADNLLYSIDKVELKRIDPPKDVTEAMHRQMKAERERRAMILESEGKREVDINVAEGEKRAKILRAGARQNQRSKLQKRRRRRKY